MSEWREDNFLEKLTDNSRRRVGVEECPEAADLCAALESGGENGISEELRKHIAECEACTEIRDRMAFFEQASEKDFDGESMEAEKRLDLWMKGFLAAKELESRTGSRPSELKVTEFPAGAKARASSRMHWGLAAAAAIVLAASVWYVRHTGHRLIAPAEVARTDANPKTVVPESKVASQPQEKVSGGQETAKISAVAPAQIRAQGPTVNAPSKGATPGQRSNVAPKSVEPTSSGEGVVAENSEVKPVETPEPLTIRPVLPPTRASAPRTGQGYTERPGQNRGCATCARGATAPRHALPVGFAQIVFAPGTRVWVSFEQKKAMPDGRFEFSGKLLLPLVLPNGISLDKGTPVVGSGTGTGELSFLQITEFELKGNRYRLKAANTASGDAAGSGKVVGFQNGEFAELWIENQGVYEPVPQQTPNGTPPQ